MCPRRQAVAVAWLPALIEEPQNCELMLRLEWPAHRVALIGTYAWGGQSRSRSASI